MRDIQNVVDWAREKGLFEKSTPIKQFMKTQAEWGEFCDDYLKENYDAAKVELGDCLVTSIIWATQRGFDPDIIDDLMGSYKRIQEGNIDRLIVCDVPQKLSLIGGGLYCSEAIVMYMSELYEDLNVIAYSMDTTLDDCLHLAYNKISKRSGEMKNGSFIKSEDMAKAKECSNG